MTTHSRIDCLWTLALCGLMAIAKADDPTLDQMEAAAAKLDDQDRAILLTLDKAPALFVAVDGKPGNPGTQDAPLDLATALSSNSPAKAGDIVWIKGGAYCGPFEKAATPCGMAGKPLIFRAMPGERVTLTAGGEAGTVLTARGDWVWFWGLELTADPEPPKVRGDTVKVAGGNGLKLINLTIHDTPNRSGIGGWDVGDDQEYVGCVVYRVGYRSNTYAHGIYTQNTKKHTVKRITDCLFFDTYGFGVHCYGQDPALANFRFEGVGAWNNSTAADAEKPAVNFLVGGYKGQDNMVLRECFTYFPPTGKFKRGADVGYVAKTNDEMRVENCTFVGGTPALHIVNWRKPTVRGNRFASPHGLVHLVPSAPPEASLSTVDGNTYYTMGVEKPFSTFKDPYRWRTDTNSHLFTAEAWKAAFHVDANSRFHAAPEGVWLLARPNRFEPQRVQLAVYNWTGAARVGLDLSAWLKPGQVFRIVNADDPWGAPAAKGNFDGKPVDIAVGSPDCPEFSCFLLFRGA